MPYNEDENHSSSEFYYPKKYIYILRTCEACTEKYCLRFFVQTERGRSGQFFTVQTEQTRLIKDLLYGFVQCWIAICCDFVEKTKKCFRY